MRLLFLIDSLGSGGAQRQLVTIAPLLKQQGIDVEVLCYHQDEFFVAILLENNISVHWITPTNYLVRILKVRSFIRKGNYDAVVSFLDIPDFLNCIAAVGGHKWKVITSERSAKEEKFHTYKGKLIGWIKRYSDVIVCNSENAKQLWLKYYPHYQNKLKVIYNIVALPEIAPTYAPRRNGKTHLVVAASYQYLKNPINVIEAVNLLGDSTKAKLVIDWYGMKYVSQNGTKAYDEAAKLVSKYVLQKVIHLNDPTSFISEKINEADAVGLFSRLEGLPNVICEAMFLSKPILMSRVSDYNILVDKSNGLLCNWDDILSIKDALSTLIEEWSDEQLLAAGKCSKKKAEVLFSSEIIIGQWMKIIKA